MFQFNDPHLRVTKPVTLNGVSNVFNDDGTKKVRIVHLPLAAKKGIIEQNKLIPDGLKMVIEEIPAYKPAVQTNGLEARIKELEAQLAEKHNNENGEEDSKIKHIKNKGGWPKKITENENS